MSEQRNIVHKIICGCDANQACPEWDRCLDAELAVREAVDREATAWIENHHRETETATQAAIAAHTESWPA